MPATLTVKSKPGKQLHCSVELELDSSSLQVEARIQQQIEFLFVTVGKMKREEGVVVVQTVDFVDQIVPSSRD